MCFARNFSELQRGTAEELGARRVEAEEEYGRIAFGTKPSGWPETDAGRPEGRRSGREILAATAFERISQ